MKTLRKKMIAGIMMAVLCIGMIGCGSKSNSNSEKSAGTTKSETKDAGSTTDSGEADSDSETIAAIKERGKLIMATASGYPPYEFVSVENDGKVIGIDVEFAQAIADELGVELEVQDMPFSEVITSLQSGNCDIAIAGTTETEERAKVVDFTNAYVEDKFVLVVMKKDADKYKTLKDFSGKNIAVEMGSAAETVAQEELSDANITSLSLNADTFTELASGKVDAVVNSDVVAQQYAISNSDYTILDVEFASAAKKCQAAVRKGDTGFLDLVNKVIKENQDNGNFDKWIQEYSEQAAKEAAK